jgi:hypothetical protein
LPSLTVLNIGNHRIFFAVITVIYVACFPLYLALSCLSPWELHWEGLFLASRYCEEVSTLALEVQRLESQAARLGVTSKESQRLSRAAEGKRMDVRKLLQEIDLWRKVIGLSAPALSEHEVQHMFRTGDVPTALLLGDNAAMERARLLFYGRQWHLATSEEGRLNEELVYLALEVQRLAWWLQHMLDGIAAQLILEEQAVGPLPRIWDYSAGSSVPRATSAGLMAAFFAKPVHQSARTPDFFSHGRQFQLQRMQRLLKRLQSELGTPPAQPSRPPMSVQQEAEAAAAAVAHLVEDSGDLMSA